jgi:ubiquinone/menaquinone biosynthesis C-methylase UbiE
LNPAIDIREHGARREVVWGDVSVDVPYSRTFLDLLGRFRRGRDLLDELLRSEHPSYIHDRLKALLRPHGDLSAWRVMDYGCGMGGSSTCLARLGVGRIVGVDLVNDYAPLWRLRLAEAGFPETGTFVQAGDTAELPFRAEGFDAVFLNGLVEHLTPEERVGLLREALRLVKRGGDVFVTETPNRWFPRNSHTKLWGSEWLPLVAAARLAARFGPRDDFPTNDRTAIYRTGMRGASVRQIATVLGPGARAVETPEEVVTMEFLVPRNPLDTTAGKQRMGPLLLRAAKIASALTGIPMSALAPHVNVAFRKL